MPVNGVDAEQKRDLRAALRCDFLQVPRFIAQNVQKRPDASSCPFLRFLFGNMRVGYLYELCNFLLQRHRLQ